jgi:hypothetical protein
MHNQSSFFSVLRRLKSLLFLLNLWQVWDEQLLMLCTSLLASSLLNLIKNAVNFLDHDFSLLSLFFDFLSDHSSCYYFINLKIDYLIARRMIAQEIKKERQQRKIMIKKVDSILDQV